MVPEKGKQKVHQASLLESPEDKPDSTDSLVAKAFDSDPRVRAKVAQELGRIDDPRAVFALIELSSDKEEAVKMAAQRSLGNFKEDAEAIVSLEKMLQERKEQKSQPAPAPAQSQHPASSQRMAPSIEKLFSHYEPKKRELVKRKLFPSLQKFFGFSRQDWDPLQELDNISAAPSGAGEAETEELPPRQIAEAKEHIPSENAPNFPFGQKKEEPQVRAEKSDLVELDEEAEFVSPEGEKGAEEDEFKVESKFYEHALRIATTPGMGKSELKREQNRLLGNFKKEVETAFKMAAAKAKDEGFANFSGLKPGMKNLSFSELQIASITDIFYGPRRKPYARISLWDEKKEIPVLIPKERAGGITTLDRLALRKVDVDFIVEKNEIVLVASNKSKIIVVK